MSLGSIKSPAINEGDESWWIFRRLPCQIALQEQMFVPFAEATKTVLSVASENGGIVTVKASTVRLPSENKTSGLSPVRSKSTMVNIQNYALVDQNLQCTEFPQIRFERVGETEGNL